MPEGNEGPEKPVPGKGAPTPESPTVVRTSSSTARRMQAAQAGLPIPPLPLPHPGEPIGTFVLEEAIGVGGMGAVYRARDTDLDRLVALKLLPPDQAEDPELVQRFYQEGRSAAQLDHENIARVYSIGRDGPHHFIAFEYIEGVTVRRRVDEHGPMPVSEAVDITLQIANALVHAADRGVVHRDIKPSNIILTPQGRAKLVDMGLARRFEREADHGLTQSGMTLGTFDYISPEQARDPRDVDVRSDLYSLGCTIFHMLTGRPPFPDGTVLQKLLQHQEEPPPDIRTLNPAVPPELSRLITRLLAKDRDRRVQSPEQLVRDLLVIAGQLGLTILLPEQHAWIDDGRRPTWHRHLAWISPAVGFLIVVGGLVWWAREVGSPAPADGGLSPLRAGRPDVLNKARTPGIGGAVPGPAAVEPLADPDPTVATGRTIVARPNDDLAALIAAAPARSVITLVEDASSYLLGGRTSSARASGPLAGRDVTIRAEAGTRPVLRFASDARLPERGPASLLAFSGGNVTLEGLTFELDEEAPDDRAVAISGEDTELTIRGCMFRQIHQRRAGVGRNRVAIRTRLRARAASGDRPPAVFIDSCHFDGGQVAVIAEGPADLSLRDCTLGPGAPSIWLDNRQAAAPVAADLRFRHTSFLTGAGPVLAIDGTLARIQFDDNVVAPSGGALPTLVAIDAAGNLTWRGRGNLYGKMRSYLEVTRRSDNADAIADFARWSAAGPAIREQDSLAPSAPIWRDGNPFSKLVIDQENPTQAFELDSGYLASASYGARQGPFGARLNESPRGNLLTADAGPGATARGVTPEPARPDRSPAESSREADATPAEPPPIEPATPKITAGPPQARPEEDDPSLLPAMPPMIPAPAPETVAANDAGAGTSRPAAGDTRPFEAPAAATGADGQVAPAAPPAPAAHGDSEEDLIRSSEQFMNLVNRLSARGGMLKLAREADLELPVIDLPPPAENGGAGQWQIEAERGGPGRPRLRFRPSRFGPRAPTGWTTLFNLRHGSLNLQGIDILIQIPDDEAPGAGRLAAFGLGERTGLTLANCTVTVAGPAANAATIALQGPAPDAKPAEGDPSGLKASVRLEDCFVRSAGDGVIVAANRLLDLQVRNSAIATDGSLLHALGSPHIDRARTWLTVRLERAVARTKGGLAYLESPQEDAELPLTSIEAFSSIFSTAGQAALLRVEGRQVQMDRSRDRIIWKAEKSAYDQITTYRRDQVLQTGVSPRDYTRNDWRTAFEPKDESAVTDSVRFFKTPERWRSACSITEADFRLDSRSPALGRGPDLSRIPSPPQADL